MNIREIAKRLNEKALECEIGNVQKIREGRTDKIFTEGENGTIHNDEGYAYHDGGRTEIQFNIGFDNNLSSKFVEDDSLRYGLAFSLQTSHELTEPVKHFRPKIRELNNIFKKIPGYFSDYLLWRVKVDDDITSEPMNMNEINEIPPKFVELNSFIFFGKLVKVEEIDEKEILAEFNKLLPVYRAVEEDIELTIKDTEEKEFVFNKEDRELVFSREYSSTEEQKKIHLRHSKIQAKLKEELKEEYGEKNVSLEHSVLGNRIDAVVRKDEDYIFYEVKTASTVKDCIRQAIGQLLEYDFWPDKERASKLVVVGEPDIEEESKKFLGLLNKGI